MTTIILNKSKKIKTLSEDELQKYCFTLEKVTENIDGLDLFL